LTSEGWKLRDGAIDVVIENTNSKRGRVVVSVNYRPVFQDRIDVQSSKSRSNFLEQVKKKIKDIDLDIVGRMLETLSLAIVSGGDDATQPHDGQEVSIGSRTAVIRPDGIYVIGDGEERKVSNFHVILKQDQIIDDGVEESRWLRGDVHLENEVLPLKMPGSALGTPIEFSKGIFSAVGSAVNFFGTGAEAIVREVALASSQATRTRNEQALGWDKEGRYRTPKESFDANGPVKLDGIEVNLEGQRVADHLGMTWIDDDELLDLGRHIHDDFLEQHPHAVMFPLLGHVFLAPLFSLLKIQGRPALMLRGASGCGKTTLARESQSFFGTGFEHENSVETWLSTPNAIQRTGFFFRDSIYVVDDWKVSHLRDPATALAVLQAYADGTARQRLMRDARHSSNSYPIRGALLLTGEDAPSDQTSVAARVMIVEVKGCANLEAGNRCLERCHEYNGFMARYVSWLAGRISDHYYTDRGPRNLQRLFDGKLMNTPNRPRIVSNLGLNSLGFETFLEFLTYTGAIDADRMYELLAEYETIALRLFETNAALVGEQRATDIFLNTLRERIAAGECVFADEPGQRPMGGGRVVGFLGQGEYVQLMMQEAYGAVEEHLHRQGRTIGISCRMLIKDLHDQKLIVPAGQTKTEHDGKRPRVWLIRQKDLDFDRFFPEADLEAEALTNSSRRTFS